MWKTAHTSSSSNARATGCTTGSTKRKGSLMKTEKFLRRPFEVNAVQVTPQNAAEIAEWCGGTVGEADYKLAGFVCKMGTVLVPGNGPNKGRNIEARIGSYVLELDGKFRVLRKQQFHEMFSPAMGLLRESLKPGDFVQDKDEHDGVWQGEVVYVDQVLVTYPFKGNVLHEANQLIKIDAYSEQTEKNWLLSAEADKGVPYNEALAKINAMRAAAQDAIGDGEIDPPAQGELDDVTEVNGM